jgi:hypothetical protein
MAFALIAVDTSFQQIVVEQALAYAQEMEKVLDQTADGKVLDACETLSLAQGRGLLRDILTSAMQQQADHVEKKGVRPVLARVDMPVATRDGRRERS